jgi:hypothetical protein
MKKILKIVVIISSLVGMYIAKDSIDKSNNSRTQMLDNLEDGSVKAPKKP